MLIKIGDLVHIKAHSDVNIRENNEIWLVLGKFYDGFISIQNVRTGDRVQYTDFMLIKIKTDRI